MKRRIRGCVLLVLLVLIMPRGMAQETQETQAAQETQEAQEALDPETEAQPSEAAADAKGSALLRETLPMDIKTASFTELADWCRRLGLSTQGDRATLEKLIYEYYEVRPSVSGGTGKSELHIESAQRTEYFSLESFKEDYVRLDGGVQLKMVDTEKGHTYTIKANSVLYNQTLKLLSAIGDVEYTITGEGRDEMFTGESLTLNIDTWEGYFFEGTTSRERTIEEAPLTFRIQGEFVSRSSSDFVIMENARITSSPAIPANYQIKADKIWILAPGEWGLSSATLNVGNIPVFYFPFFFYPGDEVVFHPVYGMRTREGIFMQTTTYFIGNRKNEEFPLSFLQLTDDSANDKVKERHGIFLRDTDTKLENTDRYLKAMFDVYSNLGIFAGLGGELSGIHPNLKTVTFDLGIGISRNLYRNTVTGVFDAYTPYFQENSSAPPEDSQWNHTMMGSVEIPFRFGSMIKLSLAFQQLSLNFLLETYSDPYIEEDFYDRAEQIDWTKLFGGTDEDVTIPLKEILTWQLDGSYSPDVSFLSPYVSNFSIPRFLVSLGWRSKEDMSKTYQAAGSYKYSVDPTRRFYYPDSMTLPEISFQIGGTLFSSDTKPAASGDTAQADDPGEKDKRVPELVRPPWEETEEERAEEKEEDSADSLRLPNTFKDIQVSFFPVPFGYTIGYSLNPRISYQTKTNSREWDTPEDINYKFAYSTVTVQNSAQLSYNFRFYESLFQTQGALNMTTQYQNVDFHDDTLTVQEQDNLLLQAYRYSSLNLTNNLDLATYPLTRTDMFKSSNLRYNLQTLLYRKSFDPSSSVNNPSYRDEFFSPGKNYITSSRLNLDTSVETLPVTPRVQLSYVLPPLDEIFTATGILITGPLTSTTAFQTRNLENRWVNQPISFDEYLRLDDQVSLRATYLYDYEESTPYSFVANLQLWHLTSSFQARYTEPYKFESRDSGWIMDPDKRFIPSNLNFSLNYSLTSDPMWKNRIRFSLTLNSSWNMDLIRYTESALNFSYTLTLSVYRILDLKFSAQSSNNMMYTYFPGYADKIGIERRNPLTDLAKSFNFFNSDARYESYFKVASISLEAVHHLDDWDLSISYTGKPELLTMSNGTRQFTWDSVLGIYLKWVPIPQIKSEFKY